MAQTRPSQLRRQLLAYALSMPEAWEDHPWGESVVKVGKKIFVFFGTADSTDPGMGVKVPESQPLALAQTGVTPMRYGLGKAGWVSIRFNAEMPFEMLCDWIDESYRSVAPRKRAGASSGRAR